MLTIQFSHPWLLLLLVLTVGLALFTYLKVNRKYRNTRNRIVSLVLYLLVSIFAITTLAGIQFTYTKPNTQNEILLLVDVSETEAQAKEDRDDFVKAVLKEGQFDNYRIGVVTFGFDQAYAVPLTTDVEGIYDRYLDAALPDTSATNIAAALTYASELFNYPESGKIVLITDGKETDENAKGVIRSISAQGIRVDAAHIPSYYDGDDVQVTDIVLPDYHVKQKENCYIGVTVQAKQNPEDSKVVTVELFDNGISTGEVLETVLMTGPQTVTFTHVFEGEGLHEIEARIAVTKGDDLLLTNNNYQTYLNLTVFDKILILERGVGESEELSALLKTDDKYEVEIANLSSGSNIPATVDDLRQYDQVIMNNVANADMPDGLIDMLYEYVNVYGGGMFTVGGNDDRGEANAYNREDMYNTTYQKMLPVQVIDYTPPVGVVVIIDRSGSMMTDGKLDDAKAGAYACLDAMTDRDYLGVMTLESDYAMVLPLTAAHKREQIGIAINSIEDASGGTVYNGAIKRAGQVLIANNSVAKRHIIMVTDGQVSKDQEEDYLKDIDYYYKEHNITLSIVCIGMPPAAREQMETAVSYGHGRLYEGRNVVMEMREDLRAPDIIDVNPEPFFPIIANELSPVVKDIERTEEEGVRSDRMTVELGGFYGTKARADADVILQGDYEVPVYAQWKFGNGMVGSFMCDLQGIWSSEFMSDVNGQTFIYNVIDNLMPSEDIRPKSMDVKFLEDNYTNRLAVHTALADGEKVEGEIVWQDAEGEQRVSLNQASTATSEEKAAMAAYVLSPLSADNLYSDCKFVVKKTGVYKITLRKIAANGSVIEQIDSYKEFSYSEEYDVFVNEDVDLVSYMASLAKDGKGTMIEDLEDPADVFKYFVTTLTKEFDPRILFMILALILFLLDVAVRKFKFKWPHEIIREYKAKKNKK